MKQSLSKQPIFFSKLISIKEVVTSITFLLVVVLLLVFSKHSLDSIKSSINIFLTCLLPSLMPFIILSEFALNTNILNNVSTTFGSFLTKLFKLPKESSIAIILGFLCGFPTGSKAVNTLYNLGSINKKQAYTLLSFVNNCNPAFIITAIGIGVFGNISIGVILFISHYLSAILLGMFFSRLNYTTIIHENSRNSKDIYENNLFLRKFSNRNSFRKDNSNFIDILKKAILNSFLTLGIIFGFVAIFNLIFDSLKIILANTSISNEFILLFSGIFEISRGSFDLLKLNMSIQNIICIESFLLGFSGLCIIFQVFSTISEHNFKFRKLIFFKLLHGILSAIITYALLRYTNLLNFDSLQILNNLDSYTTLFEFRASLTKAYLISVSIILVILACFWFYLKLKKVATNDYFKEGG